MILTDDQKRMYEGEYGPGMRKAMTMLVEYGEVFDAERMVKVSNAHTGLGPEGFLEEMIEGVDRIRAFTTTHAAGAGAGRLSPAMGIKEEVCKQQAQALNKTLAVCVPKGFIPANTCAPYQVGNVPSPGTVFSWPG